MKEIPISEYSKVYSTTTRGYLLALSLLALLSFMAYATMHRVINSHQHQAAVINLSGRQRMLSQRIALFLEFLHCNSALSSSWVSRKNKAELQSELAMILKQFESAHSGLSTGSPLIGPPSPAVSEIYFGNEYHLNQDVQTFITSARAQLEAAEIKPARCSRAQDKVLELALSVMLPKLDLVVQLNQSESELQVRKLQNIELIILLFTLTLLSIEAFFIFKPMAVSISRLLKSAIEAQSSAIEATNAKSAFLATITHEIRTPMAGVLGITEFMLESDVTAEQKAHLLTVKRLSETLVTLVNDILDYSKIEAGKLSIETVDFDLATLLNDSRILFAAVAESKRVKLRVESDPRLPEHFRGDPTRIRQVITNFIGNAVKFTPEGGSIVLNVLRSLRSKASNITVIRIEVTDTGIGIPAAARDRIFHRFSQADTSTTRKYGGSGLGLSICKQIIELMGGSIGFESTEGQGSTFWFEIGLEHAAGPADTPAQTPPPDSTVVLTDDKKYTILLAEDDEIIRQVLTTQLSQAGLQVESVKNGMEAVTAIASVYFDVILLDCEMPIMDGFQAAREIRSIELAGKLKRTPIVAMTGHSSESVRAQCLAAGMDDFLTKPVKRDRLMTLITSIVKTKASR